MAFAIGPVLLGDFFAIVRQQLRTTNCWYEHSKLFVWKPSARPDGIRLLQRMILCDCLVNPLYVRGHWRPLERVQGIRPQRFLHG